MQNWDLKTVEAEPHPHQPQILASGDDARIVLHLLGGEGPSGRRFKSCLPD